MILSEKLLFLRRQRGLSQEELANILNISRQAVHKWETTRSKPDVDNLVKLSKIFGVSLDILLKDNVDLNYMSDVKKESKAELGEVILDDDADANLWVANASDADKLFPEYKRKEKNLNTTNRIINIILLLPFLASIILLILYGPNDEVPLWFSIPLFVVVIALALLPIYWIKLLIMNGLTNNLDKRRTNKLNAYNRQRFLRESSLVDSRKYDFCTQMACDYLAWFFYDKSRQVLGVFGNSKEIFICPIQNFVDITFDGDVWIHFSDKDGNLDQYLAASSIDGEEEMATTIIRDIKRRMNFEKSKCI